MWIFFSATTHGNESYYLTMNSILLRCLKDVLYYFSKLNIFKLIYGELKNKWHMVNNTKYVQFSSIFHNSVNLLRWKNNYSG